MSVFLARRSSAYLLLCGYIAALAHAGCGATTGPEDEDAWGRPGPTVMPEICNGLDDDGDGLVASGVLDGGPFHDADVRDVGPRVDVGMGMDGGPLDGGPVDGGAPRDVGPLRDTGDGGRGDAGMADLDLRIDEDFRDSDGRYITDLHCGTCGNACRPTRPHELASACGLIDEFPVCVATRCEAGYTPSRSGRCVPIYERLCLTCADDGDCGDFEGARCSNIGDERRCAVDCALTCPDGYACDDGVCAPRNGSCSCMAGMDFDLACALEDPMGNRCAGSATCRAGVLSECVAPVDACDEIDNDCNGTIDDLYRDERGAYIRDIHNCGECGVDCTLSTIPEGDLVCGGDPFAPTCVLRCPDTEDGIMPGDRVDADRNIATGCECTVQALTDDAGPVRTMGQMLDVNCDGADGIVTSSIYVAPDGDDAGPGSPTRPMRTLNAAVMRAQASLSTAMPRPHVFIASGTYAETLTLLDGVLVHGGYRRDFLALDPDGFRVEIRAPLDTTAPGGAAVVVRGAGMTETILEWVKIRGLDATRASQATFGVYAIDPGPRLIVRDSEVRAGAGGAGDQGMNGEAGPSFMSLPEVGQAPRGAAETPDHLCSPTDANQVRGGAGGRNVCMGTDVSGGAGGTASCPSFAMFQATGSPGRGVLAGAAGDGGAGGQDSRGPITADTGTCSRDVCCGLADFTVPGDFMGPQPGLPGSDGTSGTAGRACSDAFGRFDGDSWVGETPTGGTEGRAGAGGGGGGAGGGAEMVWFDRDCEFPDGLGGGGGGGGAGGCGGAPGQPGTSGAPSVAILFRYTASTAGLPTLTNLDIVPSDGGRGGDGGAGGDGGRGANGAFGGSVARSERSTPTLSGPFAGGRGGQGGTGGAGGGAGGGCGGSSVGVWVTDRSLTASELSTLRMANRFTLGRAGSRGRGGGGAAAGPDGAMGVAMDVVAR